MKHILTRPCAIGRGRGYSLIELLVAITIAVFLLAGLFTIFQGTRHTSTEQTGLAELQDEERVAMTLLTEIVQSAGYYPNVVGNTIPGALPVDGGNFVVAGQSLYGTVAASGPGGTLPPPETLSVRYQTASADGVLNCNGGSNNTGSNQNYVNTFAISVDATSGISQLTCLTQQGAPTSGVAAAGTTVMPLVNNLVDMTFLYAINTKDADSATSPDSLGNGTSTTNNGCPGDTYQSTGSMQNLTTTNDWTNVCAIQVQLTFLNPLYQPAGQPQPTPGQPQYITFQRVIPIMGKAGVNSTTVVTTNGSSTSTGT